MDLSTDREIRTVCRTHPDGSCSYEITHHDPDGTVLSREVGHCDEDLFRFAVGMAINGLFSVDDPELFDS
jgi:hypothetical protein